MKIMWEKFLKLFTEIKLKFFGKKKDIIKDTKGITNIGSEILNNIQELERGIIINEYNKYAEFYYSNGNWFISDKKGEFYLYSIDKLQIGKA